MICEKCGYEITKGKKFCPNCGYEIKKKINKLSVGTIIGVIIILSIVLFFVFPVIIMLFKGI